MESLGNLSRDSDVMVMGGASILGGREMRAVVRGSLSAMDPLAVVESYVGEVERWPS